MWRVMHSWLLTALLAAPFALTQAQEPSADDIRGLDEQVQDVKTEVLDIAAEFNRLEQRLLYPSATRLTVSLAMIANEDVRLSAVEVRLDGDLVAHHVYSDGEVEALQKGGVQTLHTGNVAAGEHELAVRAIGKHAAGTDFVRRGRHVFTKGVEAKALKIMIVPTEAEDGCTTLTRVNGSKRSNRSARKYTGMVMSSSRSVTRSGTSPSTQASPWVTSN